MKDFREEIERARYLINSTFNSLVFKEDTHQYFLPQPDGSMKEYDCVSNFTKQWDTSDWDEILRKYAQDHGETPEYWRAEWDKKGEAACKMGTLVHEYAESLGWLSIGRSDLVVPTVSKYFSESSGTMIPPKGFDKQSLKMRAASQFWKEIHPDLHFVMAETKVYTGVGPFSENYPQGYAGTFDLLLYYDNKQNPENSGFCIFDYKGLPLDTPIPTTTGFVNMGDLTEGMEVFDRDGNPCKILHCSEVHHNPCYKIIFSNGEEIVSDVDHRWEITLDPKEAPKVMTTSEIRDYLKSDKIKFIPKIKNPSCIKLGKGEVKDFPVDPYVLGVYLGRAKEGVISDPEIQKKIMLRGLSDGELCAVYSMGVDLESERHLPYSFLTAAHIDRLGFLLGIAEASGCLSKKPGKIHKVIARRRNIRNFVVELLGSLGISSTVLVRRETQPSGKRIKVWEINFKGTPVEGPRGFRKIKSVIEVPQVPTRCIEVDSPSHTYLCTRRFLVTHNTNKELTKPFAKRKGQMLAYPFTEFVEEPQSHYTLQLSCYQIPLEAIGLKVIARRLVHLTDKGEYKLIPLEDVTPRIRWALRQNPNSASQPGFNPNN